MSEPLVSVEMITYNHAPYIARAIEGVLRQKTNFPIELVIGEDCSTDGTREIVFDYLGKYPDIVRVVTSDNNVGAAENSFRTEMACRGKYIAYCEGDDYWHDPYKLQIQAEYLENHPECGLVHSDYDRYFTESGKKISNFNQAMNNKLPDKLGICEILRGGKYLYILTCTVMVRKDLVVDIIASDRSVYQTGKYAIGDTPRWAEIAYKAGTHYIDKSLATYNVLSNSASKSKDKVAQLVFSKSAASLFIYLADKYQLPESERQYHLDKWCQTAIPLAFYQKDREFAKSIYAINYNLTLKDRLFICGIKNKLIRMGILTYNRVLNKAHRGL